MHSQIEISNWLEKNLLRVQKPGRYVGGELNQVIKQWENTNVHVALAFPDIYDIGVSNLGLTILYDIINQTSDWLAERIYSPWIDLEELMRSNDVPVFSLESKHALSDFDIVGVSIPYETLYSNVLNLLDLGKIPVKSSERLEKFPLILAGGNSTSNPEPMADYIDVFAIGEGEDLIQEVISHWLKWKNTSTSKEILLKALSKIDGIYVPQFYIPKYKGNGDLDSIRKVNPEAPSMIYKRIVSTLPPPPVHPIVPSIEVVHDRFSIEIMRGCSRGCRFCHAGMTTRPVRERNLSQILESIENALINTGYEDIGLLSLSSSDYTHIEELVLELNKLYSQRHLNISLPSLRIDSLSIKLLELLTGSRRGGFTLAPEAATEKIRNTINKPIDSDQLISISRQIYSRGWQTIKLYFMIGLPNETEDDIVAISDLCHSVLDEGKNIHRGRASLHVSIGTFIPKAHTPFQWEKINFSAIEKKQSLLLKLIRGRGFRLDWSDSRTSKLEAWLSRGNRQMGNLIFQAWKNGAKFDAWQDQINTNAWETAMSQSRIDPAKLENPFSDDDAFLPWDHINLGVKKEFFREELKKSKENLLTINCSTKCNNCGILSFYSSEFPKRTMTQWKCPSPIKNDKHG